MPLINLADTSLFVERSGRGHPVLMISGLGGLAESWSDQVAPLSREFDVVTYDHRGVGRSDRAIAPCTIERLTQDAFSLMDALGIAEAHVVGHSAGSVIAQSMALDQPKRVTSLVLVASWPKPDAYFRRHCEMLRDILVNSGPAAYVRATVLASFPVEWIVANNELLRRQEAHYLASLPDPETLQNRIDAVLGYDRSDELRRIEQPTLVVAAADDRITPPHFSEALARAIPTAELKLFPKGGNALFRIQPREFTQAVMPFLMAHTPNYAETV